MPQEKKNKKKNRFSQFEVPKQPKPESRKVVPTPDNTKGIFERERKKLEKQKKRDQRHLDMNGQEQKKGKKLRKEDKGILNRDQRRKLRET